MEGHTGTYWDTLGPTGIHKDILNRVNIISYNMKYFKKHIFFYGEIIAGPRSLCIIKESRSITLC